MIENAIMPLQKKKHNYILSKHSAKQRIKKMNMQAILTILFCHIKHLIPKLKADGKKPLSDSQQIFTKICGFLFFIFYFYYSLLFYNSLLDLLHNHLNLLSFFKFTNFAPGYQNKDMKANLSRQQQRNVSSITIQKLTQQMLSSNTKVSTIIIM